MEISKFVLIAESLIETFFYSKYKFKFSITFVDGKILIIPWVAVLHNLGYVCQQNNH